MKNLRQKLSFINLRSYLALFIVLSFTILSCHKDDEGEGAEAVARELQSLTRAVERFKDIEVAKAEGYEVDVTGYRTGMGHHFLKAPLLDGSFEIEKPEVLLYAPNASGGMDFVAVEYAIPIKDLDNPPPAPEGFTGSEDVWEINTEFSLWTLHAWVIMENPDGVFAPRNPKLP